MTATEVTTIRQVQTEDLDAITTRLDSVFDSCRALWQMANDYGGEEGDISSMEAFRLAVLEMSRSNIRGLDACLGKLRGSRSGNFATEFDFE